MKIDISFRNVRLILLVASFGLPFFTPGMFFYKKAAEPFDSSVVVNLAEDSRISEAVPPPPCPSPTSRMGNECVLTRSARIPTTLTLPANTTLNCQGHALTAITPGAGTTPSEPQVAIFLNQPNTTSVHRCKLVDFDFGIFAINGKQTLPLAPAHQNHLFDNHIDVRYVAISLMSVDNTEIRGNVLSFKTLGGAALYVGRNSDGNKIHNNSITTNLNTAVHGALRAPGYELTTNPRVDPTMTRISPGAVTIAQIEGFEPTVLNAIIDGTIYPLTITDSLAPNAEFSEDNEFNHNEISFSGTPVDGVVVAIAQKTTISNNTVVGAAASIRSGIQSDPTRPKTFPGTCNQDRSRSRRCLDDGDCNIPGFGSLGSCHHTQTVSVLWVGNDIKILNNTINAPFNSGITWASDNTTVAGNKIKGPARAGGAGINLVGKFPLERSTVAANTVSNVETALTLTKSFQEMTALVFGARIAKNDFTGYRTIAVLTRVSLDNPPGIYYDLPSELSATIPPLIGREGNYWGTDCAKRLDRTKVKNDVDLTRNDFVTDLHSYGRSIATTLIVTAPAFPPSIQPFLRFTHRPGSPPSPRPCP